jgi:hypothetical protein
MTSVYGYDTTIMGNVTIAGNLNCNAITYLNPNLIFNPNQVGYRLAGSGFSTTAQIQQTTWYIKLPDKDNADNNLSLSTAENTLCNLNRGIYLFTLDIQINNYGVNEGGFQRSNCNINLYKKSDTTTSTIINRSDDTGNTGGITVNRGVTFCRLCTFSITTDNTQIYLTIKCAYGTSNMIEGLNISIVKIA